MRLFFKCFDPAPGAPAAAVAPAAAAPITTPPASVSTTLTLPPAGGTPPGASSSPAPAAFAIPDAYKDRPYLKGVDSSDKLYALLDGSQKIIGQPKGLAVPEANAPQAEWDKYFESTRPKDPVKEYVLTGSDKSDPKFIEALRNTFAKHGIIPKAADGIFSEVGAFLTQMAKDQGLAAQQADTNFDELAAKTFGDQRDAVLASSKKIMDRFAPADMKPLIAKLPNEQLILMAGVIDGIRKTYIKEDGPPGGAPASTGLSPAEISAQARTLMADPAYTDPFNPKHDETVQKVTALYALLKK